MTTVPEKYFYTIGDVCRITGTKPHILRYWESQFKLLRPARRYSGHRKYTQRDIDLINKIRHLIIDRRFTLAGAKREMNRQQAGVVPASEVKNVPNKTMMATLIQDLKRELDGCFEILGPAEGSAMPASSMKSSTAVIDDDTSSDINKRSLF